MDKQQQPHISRFGGTASLLAALSLAFACSELPSEAVTEDDASSPLFKPGGCKGNSCGGGGDDPAPTVTKNLLPTWDGTQTTPGVYGDGNDGIAQACPDHAVTLVPPPEGMPALPPPAVCDESGRVQVHLPGDPLAGDGQYGEPGPSFDVHKKTGKVRPTGWMRPALNLFWDCPGADSSYCNFVWTDGLATTENGHTSVTGSCALLYVDYTGKPIAPLSGLTCTPEDSDGNPIFDGFGDLVTTGFLLELHVDLTVVQ